MSSKSQSFRPYRVEDSPMHSVRHSQQLRAELPHGEPGGARAAAPQHSTTGNATSPPRSHAKVAQAETQQHGGHLHGPLQEDQSEAEPAREGSTLSLISYSESGTSPSRASPGRLHQSSQPPVNPSATQSDIVLLALTPEDAVIGADDLGTATSSQHELEDGYATEEELRYMREDTSDTLYRNGYTLPTDDYHVHVDASDGHSERMVIDVDDATEMEESDDDDDESAAPTGAVSTERAASDALQPGELPVREASTASGARGATSLSHSRSPERNVTGTRAIAVRLLHTEDQETLPPIEVDMRDMQGLRVSLARLSFTPTSTQLTVFTEPTGGEARQASSPPRISLPPENGDVNGQTPPPQQPGGPAPSHTIASVRGPSCVANGLDETRVGTSDYDAHVSGTYSSNQSTLVPQCFPCSSESRHGSVAGTGYSGGVRASHTPAMTEASSVEHGLGASGEGIRLFPLTDIGASVKSEPESGCSLQAVGRGGWPGHDDDMGE